MHYAHPVSVGLSLALLGFATIWPQYKLRKTATKAKGAGGRITSKLKTGKVYVTFSGYPSKVIRSLRSWASEIGFVVDHSFYDVPNSQRSGLDIELCVHCDTDGPDRKATLSRGPIGHTSKRKQISWIKGKPADDILPSLKLAVEDLIVS